MDGILDLLRNRVLPWLWVPVLWALACQWRLTEKIAVAAPFLVLLVAGCLGRRWGRIALAAKIEGMIPRRESADAQVVSEPVWRERLVRCLGYVQWALVVSSVVLLGLTIYASAMEF